MLPVVLSANGPSGFTIANSLRFRSSASAYLNRTPSVAGNRTTWTWSGWVKRGSLQTSTRQTIFSASDGTLQNYTEISFDTDSIRLLNYTANVKELDRTSTSVYRDPSAWYHIVLAFDTTQSTATNRQRVYINGVEVTAWTNTAQMAQNANGWVNSTQPHRVALLNGFTSYFDGYLADINFIDGQALTPSSFGEIDSTTGVWKAKRYTGTYGTNGFRLNFSNGTSTTTLGYDSSGNGNNWTTNNISLTAGSTYDWMIDSPTKFPGSSYGVGNYAVLNPLSKQTYFTYNGGTLSSANLNLTTSTGAFYLPSTIAVNSGKWYFENTFTNATSSNTRTGFTTALKDAVSGTDLTINACIYATNVATSNNFITLNGTNQQAGLTGYNSGVVGVAIDLDSLTCQFYVNGSTYGTQVTGLTAGTYAAFVYGAANCSAIANFGQRPFAFSVPSGFKSLCTYNLP